MCAHMCICAPSACSASSDQKRALESLAFTGGCEASFGMQRTEAESSGRTGSCCAIFAGPILTIFIQPANHLNQFKRKVYLLFILIRVVSIFSILYPVCKFLLLTFLRMQTSWCWVPLDFIRLRQSLCFLQIWNTLLPSINLWVARLFSLILIHAVLSANLLCHQAFSMDNVPLFHCFLSTSCYYCF